MYQGLEFIVVVIKEVYMKTLLGIEMSFEEFDKLMCEQAKGKELVVDNGKVIAVEHQISEREQQENEYYTLKQWFDTYYTIHEQKFRRLHVLGDDNTAYEQLIALYNEAEIKRARIQELERLLIENSK